ncbi:MAG: cyclic nucleotide-binding domain-containing protein [Deltaproteobacteria bacterium]|nr:MAG: cyclic nucleotide-binding domain-containing protein [Deltaproteobacteria bacterium]
MSSTITLASMLDFLVDTPMFRDLEPEELSEIVPIMQVQRLRDGQILFREGDRGDSWYVLYEGEVEVLKDAGIQQRSITFLSTRACIGEMAILDGSRRSATVRAARPSTVFRFQKGAFDRLLDDESLGAYKLVYQMARLLAARQRETTARLAELIDQDVAQPLRPKLEPLVDSSRVNE